MCAVPSEARRGYQNHCNRNVTGVNSQCVPLLGAGANAGPLQVSGFNYRPPLAHHGLRSCLTLRSEYRIIDTSGSLGTFIGQSGYLLSCGMARGTLALQPRWWHKSSSQETRGQPGQRIMPGSLVLSTQRAPASKETAARGSGCESTVHLSLRWPSHCIRVLLTVVFAKH